LETRAHLCDVETSERLFKNIALYEKIEKISSSHVFQDLREIK